MKPTNTQQAVLQSAAKHPQRKLLELPGNLKGGARTKVLQALIKAKWIEPCGSEPDAFAITPLGLQVIGHTPVVNPAAERVQREGTKQAALIALLKQPAGATLEQMVRATGWQSHYADVLVMPTIIGNPACVAESAAMKSA